MKTDMNNDKHAQANFDARHIERFLAKIAADTRNELEAINRQLRHDRHRIHHKAYEKSLRFHREQASYIRQTMATMTQQRLSRERAAIRRARWQTLSVLQEKIMARVDQEIRQRWQDPGAQWQWCRHWLTEAVGLAEGARLVIAIGGNALPATIRNIAGMLSDYPAGHEIETLGAQDPGIQIVWHETLLDGRLAAQLHHAEKLIFNELNLWLHRDLVRESVKHEHG